MTIMRPPAADADLSDQRTFIREEDHDMDEVETKIPVKNEPKTTVSPPARRGADLLHDRGYRDKLPRGLPVGLEIIPAADQVVPDPRHVGCRGVDLGHLDRASRLLEPLVRHRWPVPPY